MAGKTLVNGTSYEVKGGRALVDGTGYSIKGGRTLVDGTGYDISFGKTVTISVDMDFSNNESSTSTVGCLMVFGVIVYDASGNKVDDICCNAWTDITTNIEKNFSNKIYGCKHTVRTFESSVGGYMKIYAQDPGGSKANIKVYLNGTVIEEGTSVNDFRVDITGNASIVNDNPNLGVNITMEV